MDITLVPKVPSSTAHGTCLRACHCSGTPGISPWWVNVLVIGRYLGERGGPDQLAPAQTSQCAVCCAL